MRSFFRFAVVGSILSVAGLARAQSLSEAPPVDALTLDPAPVEVKALSDHAKEQDWRFSFMFYIWVPGFSGDVGAGGDSSSVNNYPADILENLNMAFLGEVELNAGPFTLIANGMYLGFEWDDIGPRDRGTVNLDGLILDVVAGFNIAQWPMGKSGRIVLQPIAGFRYYDIELSLDVDDLGDIDVGTDLFDPVVGARVIFEFDKHWVIKLRGDVGGFGVGTELSWQVDASLNYWFNRHFFLSLGYKALGLDLDDGSDDDRFILDGVLHGPYLGIGFAL